MLQLIFTGNIWSNAGLWIKLLLPGQIEVGVNGKVYKTHEGHDLSSANFKSPLGFSMFNQAQNFPDH